MSRFLPPGGPYNIANPDADGFTDEAADLLQRIGDNMEVRRASTEGRIPSPVSRAYMFYANLFQHSIGAPSNGEDVDAVKGSEGRQMLQESARHTLRGLLATFALRDVLDLTITSKQVTLSEGPDKPISSVLLPTLSATPGGEDMWNPIRFYTIQSNNTEEVLAGHSPLTGIYPAATPPRDLTGLFWYDHENGRWYDPTSKTLDEDGRMRISAATRQRIRQLIRKWLDHVLANVSQSNLQVQGLEMDPHDANRMMGEMQQWRSELANVDVPKSIEVKESPISNRAGEVPLPFLNAVVKANADHIWSDLPFHNGRLIVTKDHLRSDTTRIYGRVFGTNMLEAVVDQLPETGENLGKALNMGDTEVPLPFLFIDRLFTRNLTPITSADEHEEGPSGLSREWRSLEVESLGTTEYYFIPMDPKILEIMEADVLFEALSARLADDGQNYVVQLQFGETTITKLYSTAGKGDHQVDQEIQRDEFDLRLFPNYDLDAVRDLIATEDADSYVDDTYYARLRLSPMWDFHDVEPFAVEGKTVHRKIEDTSVVIGNDAQRSGGVKSPGKAVFYTISQKPDGFHVPGRGFCLLDLQDPTPAGETTSEWSVGVDFGTSNTCVAYRTAQDREPEPLQMPVLTTTLLATPRYDARFGHVFEGGSAALDFFYKFGSDDQELMSQLYFPTQLLTQQNTVESDDDFLVENGLIYFDNISLEDPTLLSLIKGFPQTTRDVAERFSVKQDIKWDRTDWLRVFMHHLRKQVVLTAAARNARITELHFSYPKSFNYDRRQRFEADLDMVWGDTVSSSVQLSSESEAARDYVVEGRNQHVIFDIGGGTTDIIAFDNQEPVFQTSFKLAAGQVNDFILEAPQFRGKFVEAVERSAKRKVLEDQIMPELIEQFKEPATNRQDKGVVQQLWLGLLQRITDVDASNEAELLVRILNYLRTEADHGDAIQGFFLSNALLMGGLAYYAGQLLKEASEGAFDNDPFPLSRVTITLTGNGSRLYNMLNDPKYNFSDVMERLFLAGADAKENEIPMRFEGLFRHNNVVAPKVTVALGLLRTQKKGELRDVPVANITGEAEYPQPMGETTFDSSLVNYYQAVQRGQTRMEPPQQVPPNLEQFLEALGEAMPYGMHGEFKVIPESHKDWSDDLKKDVYREAIPDIKDRGYANAELAEGIEKIAKEDRPALEPLFIAELAGLIKAVRNRYAQ